MSNVLHWSVASHCRNYGFQASRQRNETQHRRPAAKADNQSERDIWFGKSVDADEHVVGTSYAVHTCSRNVRLSESQ